MTKEDRRAYDKELYEWCKEHKFCVRCRGEKAASGRVMCLNCLDKQRIHDEIRREEKKAYREKNKEKNRAKCKSRYKALVRSMRPVSRMSFYGKYAREGVTT